MRQTLLLATHMLYAPKRYDANCGGYSHFAVVLNSGQLRQQEWQTTEVAEKWLPVVDQWLGELMHWLIRPMSAEQFQGEMDRFVTAMKRIKAEWESDSQNHQLLKQFIDFIEKHQSPETR